MLVVDPVTAATEDVFEWSDTETEQPPETTANGKDKEEEGKRRHVPLVRVHSRGQHADP